MAVPEGRANSFVGTEEYLAPEIINGVGHTAAVDWCRPARSGLALSQHACSMHRRSGACAEQPRHRPGRRLTPRSLSPWQRLASADAGPSRHA